MQNHDPRDPLLGCDVGGYRLEQLAGAGGTGRVYRAVNESGEVVAIKVLACNQFSEANLSAWRREARLVGRIEHPHLIRVHAADRTNSFEYCIYEWAAKGSLADLMRSRQLPATEAAEIVSKVALGCAGLHANRILHRDIKPSNVLIDANDEIKLADFGAARAQDETVISDSVGCIGTPGYMSPEQLGLIAVPVGETTDVYALGALMYALLVGKGPFSGGSTIEIIARSARGQFDRPSVLREIPESLERICLKCLQRQPSDRYPSVDALYVDLKNFREGRSVSARPLFDTSSQKRSWNHVTALASAAVVFAAVFVSLFLFAFSPDRFKEPNTPSEGELQTTSFVGSQLREQEFTEQQALDRIAQLGGVVKRRDDLVVAIDLSGSAVADEDLKYLTVFTQLDAVMLEQTGVSIVGVKILPESIRRLDLGGTLVGDDDCDQLADRAKLTSVSFLASPLTDHGVERLCKNRALVELTLQSPSITDKAMDSIAACGSLESLVLNGCSGITAEGIVKLARCEKLKYLHVGETGVDDQALAILLSHCELKELGLCSSAAVSDRTMDVLASCKTLEDIFVDGSSVATSGLLKLTDLPKLRRVVARGNNVDLARLERNFGSHVSVVTRW